MMPHRSGREQRHEPDKEPCERRQAIILAALGTVIICLCCGLTALALRILLTLVPAHLLLLSFWGLSLCSNGQTDSACS